MEIGMDGFMQTSRDSWRQVWILVYIAWIPADRHECLQTGMDSLQTVIDSCRQPWIRAPADRRWFLQTVMNLYSQPWIPVDRHGFLHIAVDSCRQAWIPLADRNGIPRTGMASCRQLYILPIARNPVESDGFFIYKNYRPSTGSVTVYKISILQI
jgi:hypothetical protein